MGLKNNWNSKRKNETCLTSQILIEIRLHCTLSAGQLKRLHKIMQSW